MNNKSDDLKILVQDLKDQRKSLEKKEGRIKKDEEELIEKLSRVSKMTVDEAKKELLDQVQKSLTGITENSLKSIGLMTLR